MKLSFDYFDHDDILTASQVHATVFWRTAGGGRRAVNPPRFTIRVRRLECAQHGRAVNEVQVPSPYEIGRASCRERVLVKV